MPRQIDEFDPTAVWYPVDIDDNLEDPEPFEVLITPLSGRAKRQRDVEAVRSALTVNGDAIRATANDLVLDTIREQVPLVRRYSVRAKDGQLHEPQTGKELVEAVLDAPASELDVIHDVYTAIVDASHLATGVRKNSDARPSSSAQETRHPPALEDGPAQSASTLTAGKVTLEPQEDAPSL